MRTFAVLLSLSLFLAAGCGVETSTSIPVTVETTGGASKKLETVDAVTLDMLTASQPVVLLDFTADW